MHKARGKLQSYTGNPHTGCYDSIRKWNDNGQTVFYVLVYEVPEDTGNAKTAVLRQLIKYIESQGRQFRLWTLLANQDLWKQQMELDRQKERNLLEALTNNEQINETPRGREYYPSVYLSKYYSGRNNLYQGPPQYHHYELPYPPRETNAEEPNFPEEDYEQSEYEQSETIKRPPYNPPVRFDKGMKEEPLSDYQGNYRRNTAKQDDRKLQKQQQPEFTFKFDDSNLAEKHPFAVKPNDPRYYQDTPFSFGNTDRSNVAKTVQNETQPEQSNIQIDKTHRLHKESTGNAELQLNDPSMIILTDVGRRAEYNPIVVPVNHNFNNDIYFIAIVAGCSAAAMFALVLITLTWCRLKRGAKAAADIEYPAYGVTGPNKEVSPSGDQRLAQSAQMYHFQHQKQQIIALEKDPGSVSEAESEEENEEGDYTVYECRGLASTSEMEVRNPLFHDDPTPATPHK
ncbi:uncharacterized protein LOC143212142 isoform X2 [Lasioglossum baleicum]|uniref:uncharacterized protein LOC143212142 isoform X2 n=1 Tax=Lasioglossum baleicum TaxID=434251 RepID=UPI003FCD5E20